MFKRYKTMANIFNKLEIYNTIFFNIQSVTEYNNLQSFEKAEPEKCATWKRMALKRYIDELGSGIELEELYLDKACFLPEFSKIVSICYATVENGEDGNLKRKLDHINGNEVEIITKFIEILNEKYANGHYSKPSYVPTMCGHNVIGHDIPLLVKRIIKHRNELKELFEVPLIPLIIKHYLGCKPWESNVIDTINAWKFNGGDFISLNLVAELADLKKSVTLESKEVINEKYWLDFEGENSKQQRMKYINTQSANFTNVALQLANELRQL